MPRLIVLLLVPFNLLIVHSFSPPPPGLRNRRGHTSSRSRLDVLQLRESRENQAKTTTVAKSLDHEQNQRQTAAHQEDGPWILNPEYLKDYDQHRDWGFVYSSAPKEASASYQVVDVEGTIPSDIQGMYYKIGGAKFERGGRQYEHVLDGDGFVAAFRIQNGTVQYTGRFVETEYFLKEEATNEICYRNVFGTQRVGGPFTNAFDLTLKNVANTNVLAWGGRLFALWEAGRPYELDPVTLETLPPTLDGPFDRLGEIDCNLRGVTIDDGGPIDELVKVGRFFTAHPHVWDDDTLVAFTAAQNQKETCMEMEFVEYDQQWNLKCSTKYSFPDSTSAPHDFAVGENYYGFVENKIKVDTLPYLLGLKGPAQMMQLQLKEGARLHLVPRSSNEEKAIQVEIPPVFIIHTLARLEEEGDLITLYSNGWDLQDEAHFPRDKETVPFLGSWSGQYPDFDVVPPAKYYKTTVNIKTGALVRHEEVIPGLTMEFQTQDEKRPEICYVSAAALGGESVPGVGLAKIDLSQRIAEYWWAEPKIFTGELAPVSKQNGEEGSWLLGLIYDSTKKRTSLAILDSERFADGPVARIHLPHHVSYGLHSTFYRFDNSTP